MGEGPRLSNRKPWLDAAAGSRPSGHGVTLEPVWRSALPSRRTLLGLQRAAPSQSQVCSTLGPALCQLSARSCFSSRDPGFGKTGGRKFHTGGCSKNLSFAASGSPILHRRGLWCAHGAARQTEGEPVLPHRACVPPVDQDEKLPPGCATKGGRTPTEGDTCKRRATW